jgi:hypothetical protein
MEWKRKSESNRHTLVICHAQRPEQKVLDLQGKSTLYRQYGEKFLIHKKPRIKLWTSRNFLSGSSALAIGYFLLNFLRAFPALAFSHAARTTA